MTERATPGTPSSLAGFKKWWLLVLGRFRFVWDGMLLQVEAAELPSGDGFLH